MMRIEKRRKSQEVYRLLRVTLAWLILIMMGSLAFAQTNDGTTASPEDVSSPSAVVRASYIAISGPSGQILNLARFRSLFLPQAQLVSVNEKDGKGAARTMTLQEFTDMVTARIGKDGHVEHEIAQRVEVYGNIANV